MAWVLPECHFDGNTAGQSVPGAAARVTASDGSPLLCAEQAGVRACCKLSADFSEL